MMGCESESLQKMKIEEIEVREDELEPEEMSSDQSVGDVFDDIAEGLAGARTSALMGERETALGLLQRTVLKYARFRDILKSYPGFMALERDLEMSKAALCQDQSRMVSEVCLPLPKQVRSRRKTDRAA